MGRRHQRDLPSFRVVAANTFKVTPNTRAVSNALPARLGQKLSHRRRPFARDVTEPIRVGALILARHQAEVTANRFVPAEYQERAYADGPLPIGQGQTISQPYMVAMMTEALQLKGGESVLEVGTGSGYQSAVLSLLCKAVA